MFEKREMALLNSQLKKTNIWGNRKCDQLEKIIHTLLLEP